MNKIKSMLFVVTLGIGGVLVFGEAKALELIYDNGYGIPAPYGRLRAFTEGATQALTKRRTLEVKTLPERASHFPLVTALAPGPGVELSVEGLTNPVFIIGLDKKSLTWLEANIDDLKTQGASGYAIEGSEVDFIRVRSVLGNMGVPFNVAPGDAVAKAYGVTSYPVVLK